MTETELLKKQLKMAQGWTLNLVTELDDSFWKLTPPDVSTNINWQVGHIAVSLYHNALVCMGGSREALENLIPVKEYCDYYRAGASPMEELPAKPDKTELIKALRLIYRQVEVSLESLEEAELDYPTEVPHSKAETKRDMLLWCVHHQMWHNGVIAMLKRILLGKSIV